MELGLEKVPEFSDGHFVSTWQTTAKLDDGVPPVGFHILSKGGYLVRPVVSVEDRECTMFDADWDRSPKQLLHLLGRRSGRQIEVLSLVTEKMVSDCPAHTPGLEARILESLSNTENLFGNWQFVRKSHGEPRVTSSWIQQYRQENSECRANAERAGTSLSEFPVFARAAH